MLAIISTCLLKLLNIHTCLSEFKAFSSARSFLHLITGQIFTETGTEVLVGAEAVLVNKSNRHFSCSKDYTLVGKKH